MQCMMLFLVSVFWLALLLMALWRAERWRSLAEDSEGRARAWRSMYLCQLRMGEALLREMQEAAGR